MDLFDLTLPTPEENLALDEALLDENEQSDQPLESLRLWEAADPMVVMGRNSQLDAEVHLEACRNRGIPILRRSSGGAAIVATRGCLMYAVVLSYELRPELRMLDEAHRYVLETTLAALRPFATDVARQGTSDLTLGQAKISGNSMRCRRRGLLYHGTLLYDFAFDLADECLRMPPRQPEYRASRANRAFLTNLPAAASDLRRSLVDVWHARPAERDWPRLRVAELVAARYSQAEWNHRK